MNGLTYPGLRDGPGTLGRPGILGVRDRVCFVAHNHTEDTASAMRQRQDDGMSASKTNGYEIKMVVKTVGHLLLQGYRPDQARYSFKRRIQSVVGNMGIHSRFRSYAEISVRGHLSFHRGLYVNRFPPRSRYEETLYPALPISPRL